MKIYLTQNYGWQVDEAKKHSTTWVLKKKLKLKKNWKEDAQLLKVDLWHVGHSFRLE